MTELRAVIDYLTHVRVIGRRLLATAVVKIQRPALTASTHCTHCTHCAQKNRRTAELQLNNGWDRGRSGYNWAIYCWR